MAVQIYELAFSTGVLPSVIANLKDTHLLPERTLHLSSEVADAAIDCHSYDRVCLVHLKM